MSEEPEGGDEPEEAGETEEPDEPETGVDVDEGERLPLSDLRERIEAEQAAKAESGEVTEDAPLSELARESQSSTESERSELFEEVDVGDIDAEAVWEAVVEEGTPPEEALGDLQDTAAAEVEAAEPAGVDEHVVDKREYCQRCEFFSEPPEATCTNEGTEILELVDSDSFRVRNCPKVEAAEEELSSVVEE